MGVADGATDTPLNAAVCSPSVQARVQCPDLRVWGGEEGKEGEVMSAAVEPVGMDINMAFTPIAAQSWAFSEKALQMHTNIEAWETWTAKYNPWIKSQGCAGGKRMESMNWYENPVRNCMRVRIRAKRLELSAPPGVVNSPIWCFPCRRESANQSLFKALTIPLKRKSQNRRFQQLKS